MTDEKHDNVRVLQRQRTEAREEINRIKTWLMRVVASDHGVLSRLIRDELDQKLIRLRDRYLREDVESV